MPGPGPGIFFMAADKEKEGWAGFLNCGAGHLILINEKYSTHSWRFSHTGRLCNTIDSG